MPKSTLPHTRTDSHFFSPPKCRPEGAKGKSRGVTKQALNHVLLSHWLKNYTNIVLTGLAKVRAKPFDQLNITFFTLRQQTEKFPH